MPADYRENSQLDHVVKTILDKMATERDLDILKVKEDKKKKMAQTKPSKLSRKLSILAKRLTKKRNKAPKA